MLVNENQIRALIRLLGDEDERIVKQSLKRQGIKATRPNVIRYLLAQEAQRIRKSDKKP